MKKIKKSILLILVLSLMFTLVACGESSDEAKSDEVKSTESEEVNEIEDTEEVDSVEEDNESMDSYEGDFGTTRVVYEKDNLNLEAESGPIKFKITSVFLGDLELDPEAEDIDFYFDKSEGNQTILLLDVEVENTTDQDVSIYPDQATIVTNTKEQKEAEIFMSDDVGGDFYGEVKKEGTITFLLDSAPEDITQIKYILRGAHDANTFDNLGEEITIEYNFE